MKRCLAAIGLLCLLRSAVPGSEATAQVHVEVAQGRLAGGQQGEVAAFLGVPYAAPPVGANRWRAPQPAPAWNGVRPAREFGARCFQAPPPGGSSPYTHEYYDTVSELSEDCLFLNVWTPVKREKPLPVLVWIHGGAFVGGSGAVPIYNGAALARRGIVVVTINYRLGALGFLAHPELSREAAGAPPANFGLQDMIAALQWIRANIEAFGGDPEAVTIAGQSAGAMAVHAMVVSPLARDLFRGAIAQSALPSLRPPAPLADGERAGIAFAVEKGVGSLPELRALTPEQIVGTAGPLRFFPIVDGVLLPDSPERLVAQGRFNDVPMIIGLTADERATHPAYGTTDPAAFRTLLGETYGAQARRVAGRYPARTETERSQSSKQLLRDGGLGALYAWTRVRLAGGQTPVYAYLYSHPEAGPESARWGAFHSSEIADVFQTFDAAPERNYTEEDRRLSEQMSTYWLNFVRTGDPNGAEPPDWPRLRAADPRILEFAAPIRSRPLLPRPKLEAMGAFIAAGGKPVLF